MLLFNSPRTVANPLLQSVCKNYWTMSYRGEIALIRGNVKGNRFILTHGGQRSAAKTLSMITNWWISEMDSAA